MLKILAVNPGSTSTKLAIFDGESEIKSQTLYHSSEALKHFKKTSDQYEFRVEKIKNFLDQSNYVLSDFAAFVGRGGLVKPLQGGTYVVNDLMVKELKEAKYGEHASNLGAIIVDEFSKLTGKPAFIVDPVVVDEMDDIARISGHPDFERRSIFHALNQKAVARKAAESLERRYEECNFIIAHMGGGISVGAHKKGRVVDVNNALDGDGPFSPERSGTLPLTSLIDLCYSGRYTLDEMKRNIKGAGGLIAHLGTNNAIDIQKMIDNGNKHAELIYHAMAYQISKWIGRMVIPLNGNVDAIILTGGIAYDSNHIIKWIKEKVSYIAPVIVFPGGREEEALAMGAIRVLRGEEKAKNYA